MSLVHRIGEFGRLLRKNGVNASTAEVMDACQAAEVLGFEDSRTLRSALRATLVKRLEDEDLFDELFDVHFQRRQVLGDGSCSSVTAALPRDVAVFVGERLRDIATNRGAVALQLLGFSATGAGRAMVEAAGIAGLRNISSPLQVGYYSARISQLMGIDGAARSIEAALDDFDEDIAALVRPQVQHNLSTLRESIRSYVRLEQQRVNPGHQRRLALDALSERNFATLSARDSEQLRDQVFRLARLLRSRLLHPRIRKRRGRLDLGKMLRRSLSADGTPYQIIFRRQHEKKPRVVVLCDVSDSVRNVSLFMLQLVYALHDCFDRVESFAFVSNVGELTSLFKNRDLDHALAAVAAGQAVNLYSNSNYGTALRSFCALYLGRVTRRTTVLIIGDGRNNYNEPATEALAELQRRARRILWLTPEPEALWGFGDSVLHDYARHCDKVLVARNLASLRRVIDELATGG